MNQLEIDFTGRFVAVGGKDSGLTAKDLEDLTASCKRVFELMKDGRWHPAQEICLAAGEGGVPASEGLRRMRELRRVFSIEKCRIEGSRRFAYRIATGG